MKYSEIAENEISVSAATCMQPIHKPEISIEFPTNNQRAREVISRSNTKATGKYPSWKMRRMMHYESPHERNAFRLMDACPEVTFFIEQPCCIRYVMDGTNHIHYPDILVGIPSGKELIEVKTTEEAATPEVTKRTEFMRQALPQLGYSYKVLTSDQLSKAPRLKIARILLRSGRSSVALVQREQIRQMFRANGSICWGKFKPGTVGSKYYRQICRLILEGVIWVDFNQPLVDASPIHWVADFKEGEKWA